MLDYEDKTNQYGLWDLVVCVAIIIAAAICLRAFSTPKISQSNVPNKVYHVNQK